MIATTIFVITVAIVEVIVLNNMITNYDFTIESQNSLFRLLSLLFLFFFLSLRPLFIVSYYYFILLYFIQALEEPLMLP